MKHKMWSRLLSMMLAVMMIASIVPNSAFAEAASEIAASIQVVTGLVEGTEEVTQPEEETPAAEEPVAVEPTAEPAPTEEPVAEPTAEPVTESEQPAAEPTQAPAETVAPSEEPSAEPTAAPEGTETPEGTAVPSETPAASATPAPSESPVPSETPLPSETPAPSEETSEEPENSIEELMGEELLQALLELENDSFRDALKNLTEEQAKSLSVLPEESLAKLQEKWELTEPAVPEPPVDNSEAAQFTTVGPLFNATPMMYKAKSFGLGNQHQMTEPIDGLKINKSVSKENVAEEIYKIDLSAEAESNIVITSIPCDIILVLDRSGSMKGAPAQDLTLAAENFVKTIYENSPESRVAVVAYSESGAIYSGNGQPAGAFVPVENQVQLVNSITAAMSRPNGGTNSNTGLELAYQIYQAVPSSDPNYQNSRAVVMFTDGVPGTGSWGANSSKECAQSSIYWGQVLKADKGTSITVDADDGFYGSKGTDFVERYFDWGFKWRVKADRQNMPGSGATIYTVGLGLPKNDVRINEYLYRLSSNRPDGTHVSEWGSGGYTDVRTRNLPKGYYLTTDNSAELDKIFQQIADQTGKPIENAIIRDYISPYFQLVDQNGTPIQVGDSIQSGKHEGVVCKDQNGIYVEWKNVTLKPMEPEKPETAEKFSGTLYVKPKTEFMGGTNVPTNIDGISGVYSSDEKCIGSFPHCDVDVRVKNEYNVQDQSIYITNNANISSMIVGNENGPRPFVSLGGGAYSNDFVKTVYTVNDSDGKHVGTWTFEKGKDGVWEGKAISPDECSQYTVSCTVEGGTILSMTGSNEAWVHVFTPTVTWKDSSQDYNTILTKDLLNSHASKTEWIDKHGHDAEISGAAPDISFEFVGNIVDKPIQQNLDVKISKVLIAGQDKTKHVAFAWEKDAHCPDECTAAPANAQFRIHLKTGDLTIIKTLKDDATAEKRETFLFQITGADKTYYASVVLNAGENHNDTVVKNLPADSYTVEEILCPKGYALESRNPVDGTVLVSGADASIEFVNTVATGPDDPTKDEGTAINSFVYEDGWTWTWTNKPVQ